MEAQLQRGEEADADGVSLTEMFTLERFVERHPDKISMAMLRWIARHRDENGFADAFVRLGRNLLVIEPRFARALAKRGGKR
jgi:hypothetical protein